MASVLAVTANLRTFGNTCTINIRTIKMIYHYYPEQPISGAKIEYKARGIRDFEVAEFRLTIVDGELRPMLYPALTRWHNVISWWYLDQAYEQNKKG